MQPFGRRLFLKLTTGTVGLVTAATRKPKPSPPTTTTTTVAPTTTTLPPAGASTYSTSYPTTY